VNDACWRFNFQVRVAGWNIRWNDIPRKEQDEYIARIEAVGDRL
jgi:pyruvate-formate lyase